MKKYLPYIIGGVLIAGILLAIVLRPDSGVRHIFNDRITLRQKDKIPYGTAATRSLLKPLFPQAHHYYDTKAPGDWDSIQFLSYNQAVIVVASHFNADEPELNALLHFAEEGNFVFIVARTFSNEAEAFFNFNFHSLSFDAEMNPEEDSLKLRLVPPRFLNQTTYAYPGKHFSGAFYALDTSHTLVLGRNDASQPNFIQLKTGSGAIFIHTAPLAISNYFVLHKSNIEYFQNIFSVIPSSVQRILWNEFYLTKPAYRHKEEPNIFRVLLRYPSMKWGLLTGIGALLLMVLLGSRRKQRRIPILTKPGNDSLDFVRTMGRLYYDRGDHANLARKMSAFFLDHVRSVYQLPTNPVDEKLAEALQQKSGYPREGVNDIFAFIRSLDAGPDVTSAQLASFHKQLENFYQNT